MLLCTLGEVGRRLADELLTLVPAMLEWLPAICALDLTGSTLTILAQIPRTRDTGPTKSLL